MTENRLDANMKKHRNTILLTLAILVFAAFAVYFFLHIYRYPLMNAKPAAFICLACSAAACAALVLCYKALSKKDVPIEKTFLIFMITAGIIYAIIFLPFTVPDEGEHYLSAYRISNYITFNTDQIGEERLLIRTADLQLIGQLRSNELTPQYYSLLAKNFSFFVSDKSASFIPAKFIGSAPVGYVASALGISIGRFFRLGALPTFYLGRFANLAAYIAMVWWAMKLIPYGKTALFVISALPMAIHLVSSYSYDYFVIALAILFVAQVLRMRETSGKIRARDIVFCFVIAALLAPSKLVYFPILLTIFLVPSEKFGLSGKKAALIKIGVVAAGVAFLLLMQMGKISTYMSDGNSVSWSADEVYSISYALKHPMEFIRTLFNTVYHYTDYYASMLVGNHMVGTGSSVLPIFLWAPMLAVLFFSFLRRKDDGLGEFSPSARLRTGAVAVGTSILAALSMLFSWTPISSNVIRGMQGRYLLPVLPLLIVVLRGNKITRPRNSDKYIVFACVYFNLLAPLFYFGQLFLPEFA